MDVIEDKVPLQLINTGGQQILQSCKLLIIIHLLLTFEFS